MNKRKLRFIFWIAIIFSINSWLSLAKCELTGMHIKNLGDFENLAIREGYRAFESQHNVFLRGKFRSEIFPKALVESLKNIYDHNVLKSKEDIKDNLISNIVAEIKIEAGLTLQDRVSKLLINNLQDYIAEVSKDDVYLIYQNCLETRLLNLINDPEVFVDDSDEYIQLEDLSSAIYGFVGHDGESLRLSELRTKALNFLSEINLEDFDCYPEAVRLALKGELDNLYINEYIDSLEYYDYTSLKFPLSLSITNFINVAPYTGGNFASARLGIAPYGFTTTVVSLYLQKGALGEPQGEPIQIVVNRQIEAGKCLDYSDPRSEYKIVYDDGCFFGYNYRGRERVAFQSIWLYKKYSGVPMDYLLSLPLRKMYYIERLWERINKTRKVFHIKSSDGIYPVSPLVRFNMGVKSTHHRDHRLKENLG